MKNSIIFILCIISGSLLSQEEVHRIGTKSYELSNHLNNVTTVVSDRKINTATTSKIDYAETDIISFNDYYPYGMLMEKRNDNKDYRFGFQGQEKDDEMKGKGNSLNYKYRMHDVRLGRFFAVDPLSGKYPHYSSYQFSGNKVVNSVEFEGLEEKETYYVDSHKKGNSDDMLTHKGTKLEVRLKEFVFTSSYDLELDKTNNIQFESKIYNDNIPNHDMISQYHENFNLDIQMSQELEQKWKESQPCLNCQFISYPSVSNKPSIYNFNPWGNTEHEMIFGARRDAFLQSKGLLLLPKMPAIWNSEPLRAWSESNNFVAKTTYKIVDDGWVFVQNWNLINEPLVYLNLKNPGVNHIVGGGVTPTEKLESGLNTIKTIGTMGIGSGGVEGLNNTMRLFNWGIFPGVKKAFPIEK